MILTSNIYIIIDKIAFIQTHDINKVIVKSCYWISLEKQFLRLKVLGNREL